VAYVGLHCCTYYGRLGPPLPGSATPRGRHSRGPPLRVRAAGPKRTVPNCPSVTGQSILSAGLYPRLNRPRLDYTRVYYGLGQFVPRSILWPWPINSYPLRPNYTPIISITISIVLSDILKYYLIFQEVTDDSVLSGRPKLSDNWNLKTLKMTIKFVFHGWKLGSKYWFNI